MHVNSKRKEPVHGSGYTPSFAKVVKGNEVQECHDTPVMVLEWGSLNYSGDSILVGCVVIGFFWNLNLSNRVRNFKNIMALTLGSQALNSRMLNLKYQIELFGLMWKEEENDDEVIPDSFQSIVNDYNIMENSPEHVENYPGKMENSPGHVENFGVNVENSHEKLENFPNHVENYHVHVENSTKQIENCPHHVDYFCANVENSLENSHEILDNSPNHVENSSIHVENSPV
ncbi:hypothetical protein Tco_0555531 [Tanacetum coccineum]